MKNADLIAAAVAETFTPDEIAAYNATVYSAAQIAANRAALVNPDDPTDTAAADCLMCAATYHTYREWRALGYQVKPGEHAAIICGLWKHTDSPNAAAKAKAAANGEEIDSAPHFYVAKSHLFSVKQVSKAPKAKTADEIRAYNAMLAAQRKAKKTA